jgi:sulfonate transport system substrate-binding protein
VEDLKGKKVAMVRGTDPHIFAVRALLAAGLSDKDITPVLVQQHADGGTALLRGDVDAWAGLDPMMAQHEVKDGARLSTANPRRIPGASSMCARSSPRITPTSCGA